MKSKPPAQDDGLCEECYAPIDKAGYVVLCDFHEKAGKAHDELVKVMRDVAAMLPVSARLYPDDLYSLQTRVVAALKLAEQE